MERVLHVLIVLRAVCRNMLDTFISEELRAADKQTFSRSKFTLSLLSVQVCGKL